MSRMGVPLLDLMKDNTEYDRTFKRFRVNFPLSVALTSGEETGMGDEAAREVLPGLAHNASLSGIGFVCSGLYEMGSLLDVEVTLNAQTFLLLARVCWRRTLDLPGDPMYHYGTKFERTESVLRFIPVAVEFLLAQGVVRREYVPDPTLVG